MGEAYRLVVTGSRDWADHARVWGALQAVADEMPGRPLVVVHGDASRGVDRIARRWVLRKQAYGHREITEWRYPADWDAPCRPECRPARHRRRRRDGSTYCPAAGTYRNAEMVEAQAGWLGGHPERGRCFAWIAPCSQPGCAVPGSHGSHGVTDCAGRAVMAGIDTVSWYEGSAGAVAGSGWRG